MTKPSASNVLWQNLCALAKLPPDAGLDAMHKVHHSVGRGTIQRIKAGGRGSPNTQQALADQWGIKVSQLIEPNLGSRPAGTPSDEGALGPGLAHVMSQPRPIMAPPKQAWDTLMNADLPPLFLLTMQDDALSEVAPKGRDYIFSTTEVEPPRSANVVLVQNSEGQFFARVFEEGRAGAWRAVALTAGYRALDSQEDGLRVCAIGMGPWGRRG